MGRERLIAKRRGLQEQPSPVSAAVLDRIRTCLDPCLPSKRDSRMKAFIFSHSRRFSHPQSVQVDNRLHLNTSPGEEMRHSTEPHCSFFLEVLIFYHDQILKWLHAHEGMHNTLALPKIVSVHITSAVWNTVTIPWSPVSEMWRMILFLIFLFFFPNSLSLVVSLSPPPPLRPLWRAARALWRWLSWAWKGSPACSSERIS